MTQLIYVLTVFLFLLSLVVPATVPFCLGSPLSFFLSVPLLLFPIFAMASAAAAAASAVPSVASAAVASASSTLSSSAAVSATAAAAGSYWSSSSLLQSPVDFFSFSHIGNVNEHYIQNFKFEQGKKEKGTNKQKRRGDTEVYFHAPPFLTLFCSLLPLSSPFLSAACRSEPSLFLSRCCHLCCTLCGHHSSHTEIYQAHWKALQIKLGECRIERGDKENSKGNER